MQFKLFTPIFFVNVNRCMSLKPKQTNLLKFTDQCQLQANLFVLSSGKINDR